MRLARESRYAKTPTRVTARAHIQKEINLKNTEGDLDAFVGDAERLYSSEQLADDVKVPLLYSSLEGSPFPAQFLLFARSKSYPEFQKLLRETRKIAGRLGDSVLGPADPKLTAPERVNPPIRATGANAERKPSF